MTSSVRINLYLKLPSMTGTFYRGTVTSWSSILWLLQTCRYRSRISFNPSSERVEVILEAQP